MYSITPYHAHHSLTDTIYPCNKQISLPATEVFQVKISPGGVKTKKGKIRKIWKKGREKSKMRGKCGRTDRELWRKKEEVTFLYNENFLKTPKTWHNISF